MPLRTPVKKKKKKRSVRASVFFWVHLPTPRTGVLPRLTSASGRMPSRAQRGEGTQKPHDLLALLESRRRIISMRVQAKSARPRATGKSLQTVQAVLALFRPVGGRTRERNWPVAQDGATRLRQSRFRSRWMARASCPQLPGGQRKVNKNRSRLRSSSAFLETS